MTTHVGAPHGSSASLHLDAEHLRKILSGIWRVADPKITLASMASLLLGTAAAAAEGPLAWGWVGLTVLGISCFEAAKNASGEIFDWDSGADQALHEDERSPFSGGKRVLVDHLMTRREVAIMAGVFYALGIAAGLAIVVAREPMVLLLGMFGVFLAYFYHAPPLAFSYHGLGETAVALAYGPVIACGTFLVQQHALSPIVLLPSLPLGLAIATFLVINELPDARADELAGKRTLVVRLGRASAATLFGVMVAATYALVALLPLFGLPWSVWLGFLGLPLALRATARLRLLPERVEDVVPAQGWTLLAFLALSFGISLGLVLKGPTLSF